MIAELRVLGVAASLGAAAYFVDLASGSRGWVLALLTICAAAIMGPRFRGYSFDIGVGILLAQCICAGFTYPRGDGDGLWVLIFPMVAIVALIAGLVAAYTDSLSTRRAAARSRVG